MPELELIKRVTNPDFQSIEVKTHGGGKQIMFPRNGDHYKEASHGTLQLTSFRTITTNYVQLPFSGIQHDPPLILQKNLMEKSYNFVSFPKFFCRYGIQTIMILFQEREHNFPVFYSATELRRNPMYIRLDAYKETICCFKKVLYSQVEIERYGGK